MNDDGVMVATADTDGAASADHDDEVSERIRDLERTIAEREQEVASLQQQMASAVVRYRAAVLAGTGIPEEMVHGVTVEEIDDAVARATALVDKIKKQVEARAKTERVPAGAPARQAPDLSSLSASEKIAYALVNQRGG